MRVVLLLVGIGLMVGCGVQRTTIEGRWLSDKDKTMSYVESSGIQLSAVQKQFVDDVFGKLRLDITDNQITSTWVDGSIPTETLPYTYTRDGNVYIIRTEDRTSIVTIEGDCMWVGVDILEGMREYFCRVE